ncbi:MAG: ureidoglycolate lyase [Rhodocyclaceae bacterium]
MKLVRYGTPGAERPGVLDAEGTIRDLGGQIPDLAPEALAPDALRRIAAIDPVRLPAAAAPARLGMPWSAASKIVGVGLNYRDHAKEAGMTVPAEPVLFLKAPSSLAGPQDDILLPPGAAKMDWEVELGVVIGSTARRVPAAQALEHVAGYCVVNDFSERAWQLERGGQWDKGKCFDTFCPVGPWLVTADEIRDPQALELWLDVDGVARQRGNTANMVFGVAELVSYISQVMTLVPGDLIVTGTPAGVAMGRKPAAWLRGGEEIRFGIAGLGEQRHRIVAGRD